MCSSDIVSLFVCSSDVTSLYVYSSDIALLLVCSSDIVLLFVGSSDVASLYMCSSEIVSLFVGNTGVMCGDRFFYSIYLSQITEEKYPISLSLSNTITLITDPLGKPLPLLFSNRLRVRAPHGRFLL